MSYNPVPSRAWYRVQHRCLQDFSNNLVYIPLTNQTVSVAQANYEDKLLYKGNILQYKKNSSQLTKSQKYSKMSKGVGIKTFATQSQTYSNPNTKGLLRINYTTYAFPNQIVGAPNNISGPFQYNIPNPASCTNSAVQDGGNLVCGTYANPCTNEIIKSANAGPICSPTYCSDVPGTPQLLCWNPKVQTWFPRQNLTMNSSGNKWPVNYKQFVSAITPIPPVLTIYSFSPSAGSSVPIVYLSWTNNDTVCLPITSYAIYQNGSIINTVPYQITSITFDNLVSSVNYTFYVISISNTIQSVPSNSCNFNYV
jgi:hypothetical protein